MTHNPNFIVDKKGRKTSVVLTMKEYQPIITELQELDDLRLYDEAMQKDDGKRPSLSQIK